jgi:hypothetical protein
VESILGSEFRSYLDENGKVDISKLTDAMKEEFIK